MKAALQSARLYAICDLGYLTVDQAVPVSRRLLAGGAGILQLRAKGHPPEDLLALAEELVSLASSFRVPLIINDHLELANQCGAHGVHLGQEDGSLSQARSLLGPDAIIGRSTHSLDQATQALEEKADYIGFGPLFPTPTKEGRPAIGLADLREMESRVGSRIPAFAIGGIRAETLNAVVEAGARRVVVVSHLLTSENPEKETSQLLIQLP